MGLFTPLLVLFGKGSEALHTPHRLETFYAHARTPPSHRPRRRGRALRTARPGLARSGRPAVGQRHQDGSRSEPLPGAYISPWGDARVEIGDETLAWMEREGITLEAISPFVMDVDKPGLQHADRFDGR